jgi:predicted TPR repeat methyltransferase
MSRKPPRPMPRYNVGTVLLANAGATAPLQVNFDAVTAMLGEVATPAEAALARARRLEKEEEILAQQMRAVAADPNSITKLLALGWRQQLLQRFPEALATYRRVLALDPSRVHIRHMIDALSGEATPARCPDAFVVAEFDAFAERYDEAMDTWLRYRGPELLERAVTTVLGKSPVKRDIVDLGCGTGLLATRFKPIAKRLDGVDLSSKMVAAARAKRVYDSVVVDEVVRFLARRTRRYGLALAGDVLCYFGDLREVFASVRAALLDGGHLAFTVERAVAGEGDAFTLRPTGRYAHAAGYIAATAAAAGLRECYVEEATLRMDSGKPVLGAVYVFTAA